MSRTVWRASRSRASPGESAPRHLGRSRYGRRLRTPELPMKAKLFLAATSSLAALAGPATAEDQPSTVSQVVVTAPRTTPLETVVSVDKTGTAIQDLPRSVQVVPETLLHEQGAVALTDALRDVSGAAQGGQF